jgi:hypothetical protein
MAKIFDFKRLRRLITIYAVVQVCLVALLIFTALYFQAGFQADGMSQRFLKSILVTLGIQLALFYPINRFAAKEAEREVDSCAVGLSPDELKGLRSKRMVGDVIKMAVFIFYLTFIWKAPENKAILSVVFFSFILTVLTYFQCYNFAAKRLMKEKG